MKIIRLALLLGAVCIIGYLAFLSIFSPKLIIKNEAGLGSGETIAARAWPKGTSFHLGDTISYFVEVKYNTQKVQEIDKNSIDKSLVLTPFAIRSSTAKEFSIDANTNIYLKEYRIQLVKGQISKLYSFPAATIKYRIDNKWLEKQIVLEPIPIGARFPPDLKGISLKPPKPGELTNGTSIYFSLLLAGMGIFCGLWALTEIIKKARSRQKELKNRERLLEGVEDIFRAYEGLLQKKEDPKTALHQVYQILRELLFRKQQAPEIQDLALILSALCQKAYSPEALGEKDLDEALAMLGKIFDHYTKKEEA